MLLEEIKILRKSFRIKKNKRDGMKIFLRMPIFLEETLT